MKKKLKFAFQGLKGAYHEKAAKIYLKKLKIKLSEIDFVSCNQFEDIFQGVEAGNFDYGIVAIENSLMGSLYKNFDLLQKHHLKIVGEVYVQVKLNLYSLPQIKKNDIREIISQAPALLQCEDKIHTHFPNVKITEFVDSVAASKYLTENVSETLQRGLASISPEGIGEKYKLKKIFSNFNDDPNNYTRFFIIQKNYIDLKNRRNKNYKTSIFFYGNNIVGFLYKALGCFSLRDINLSKIESRPVPKSPWKYCFYLDFEGKYDDLKVQNAINNLREYTENVKILGSYIVDEIKEKI